MLPMREERRLRPRLHPSRRSPSPNARRLRAGQGERVESPACDNHTGEAVRAAFGSQAEDALTGVLFTP